MVEPEKLVGIYSEPDEQIVDYNDGRSVHYITTVFVCRLIAGTLEGSPEGREWGWYGPDRLPSPVLPYARRWIRDALGSDGTPVVR